MMGGLWLSAYGVGVWASRQSAVACERPLACSALGGQERPDCRTISEVRTLHREACTDSVVPGVRLAGAAGRGRLGHVAMDGTKRPGKAARHQARRSGERPKAVARRREALAAWVTQADQQDEAAAAALGSRRGEALPAALARREERLAKREAARRRWETPAKAEAQAERQRRADAEAAPARTGTTRRGKAPQPVGEPPADTAQRPLTAPARPRMRTNHQGWEDCGNAPARVDATWQSSVACDVPDASNDTPQAAPVAPATLSILAQAGLARPTHASGTAQAIPGPLENGADREAAVAARETCGFDPSIATERPRHHGLQGEASATPATAQARLAATVRTPAGKALDSRRQVIGEPGCGQRQDARGCRRCVLRGLANIRGAWRRVGLTHHLRTMWRYGRVLRAADALWRPIYGREMALRRASWRCGAAMAVQRSGDVAGRDPSERAFNMPHEGSESH